MEIELWVVTLTLQNVTATVCWHWSCVPGCSVTLSLMSALLRFLPVTLLSLRAASKLPGCPQEWEKFLKFVCWHCWSRGSSVFVTCSRTLMPAKSDCSVFLRVGEKKPQSWIVGCCECSGAVRVCPIQG